MRSNPICGVTIAVLGTCVNVGCVPKKVMWNTAMIAESLHDAKDYGFLSEPNAIKFDWSVIKKSRDAYIKRLNVRAAPVAPGLLHLHLLRRFRPSSAFFANCYRGIFGSMLPIHPFSR